MELKRILECPKFQFKSLWIEKWKVISKSQVLRYEKSQFFFTKFLWEKSHILHLLHIGFGIIGIGKYEKCHMASMKNVILVFYRYRLLRKLSVPGGFISIGQYEKRLRISHLLGIGHICLMPIFFAR